MLWWAARLAQGDVSGPLPSTRFLEFLRRNFLDAGGPFWVANRSLIHGASLVQACAKTLPRTTREKSFFSAGLPLPVDALGEVIHRMRTQNEKGFAALRKMWCSADPQHERRPMRPILPFFLVALSACAPQYVETVVTEEQDLPVRRAVFAAEPQPLDAAFRSSCDSPGDELRQVSRAVVQCRIPPPPDVAAFLVLQYDGALAAPTLVVQKETARDAVKT